jgi:dolichyl-phosphate beta-glucosyltransferase
MDLSIIIPALNEEKKIAHDILAASRFLIQSELKGEIIIIDDGSTDYTSRVAIQCDVPNEVSLKIIRYEYHRGKGYAVRMGIIDSKGYIVMFMDCGGNVPLSYILTGMDLIVNSNCHIAMGSRHLPGSKIRKPLVWYRQLSSLLFRNLVKHYLKLPGQLTDTQCGFKLYNGDIARDLYENCLTEGFSFDLEIILRAQKAGYIMKEFPIEWSCDRDSRLSVFSTGKIFSELRRIKKMLR